MRIRITQDAFDEAVKETMDDFEMSYEEAVQETIEQFQVQGVDLGGLRLDDPVTRAEGGKAMRNACVAVKELMDQVNQGESSLGDIKQDMMETYEKLDGLADSEMNRNEACSHGVIASLGAVLGCVDPEITRGALKSLTNLLQTSGARERISQSTINMILASTRQFEELKLDALHTLLAAIHMDEPNKHRYMQADERVAALNDMINDNNSTIAVAACNLVRKLVLRDDLREMTDNCFNRAKTFKLRGTLGAMAAQLAKYRADVEVMPTILSCLACTCLNKENVDVLEANNAVEICEELLKNHLNNEGVTANAISMVAALAQSDKPKRVLGMGDTLKYVLTALDTYRQRIKIVSRAFKALTNLVLRAPETGRRVHELGGMTLLIDIASRFSVVTNDQKAQASNARIQAMMCMILRNIISKNKDLIEAVLDEGIEETVRIQSVHPSVNEPAFMLLKELGCAVDLNESWKGEKGDMFAVEEGTEQEGVSEEMSEFLQEYRNKTAEGVMKQAGLDDQFDLATMPQLGGQPGGSGHHAEPCCNHGNCCN